jgi:hypothetical protein
MVAMKRSLLILLLVAAALCVLAAPGVAAAQEEPETFLLAPYYDNPDMTAPIDMDYVWANPVADNPYGDWMGRLPSASRGDVIAPYSWWGVYGKGRSLTIPKYLDVSLRIYQAPAAGESLGDPVVTLTAKQARTMWLPPELVPDDWGWTPFNPRIGAKPYMRWWWWEHGPSLPQGQYLLRFRQDFRHPTFDLSIVSLSGHGPYKVMPGDRDWTYDSWFSFTVLP